MSQPTAYEQYLLELVNAERVSRGIAALASDTRLDNAADGHTAWMLAADIFSHTGANGSTPHQRIQEAGYSFFGGGTSGENVAYVSLRRPAGLIDEVELIHSNLMNSPGHRANILSSGFSEVGFGLAVGEFTSTSGTFQVMMATENFADANATGPFLTGVAIDDGDGDRFYDVGEGLGGLLVTAVRSDGLTLTTRTMDAGGYSLALGAGTYTVTFSGGGFQAQSFAVSMGSANLKLDLIDPVVAARFDGLAYTAIYGDLVAAFRGRDAATINAMATQHFNEHGAAEGRLIEGYLPFDAAQYRANYADLAGLSDQAAVLHWINNGWGEGRLGFDATAYIASYDDLIRAFGTDEAAAVRHYMTNGRAEGRTVDFDAAQYRANYADLASLSDAAAARHYVAAGRAEGRTFIDPLDYVASHPDLIQAFGDRGSAPNAASLGLQHYMGSGRAEGRDVSFDAWGYLENYADLRSAFGRDVDAAAQHYIAAGYYEGRTDADLGA